MQIDSIGDLNKAGFNVLVCDGSVILCGIFRTRLYSQYSNDRVITAVRLSNLLMAGDIYGLTKMHLDHPEVESVELLQTAPLEKQLEKEDNECSSVDEKNFVAQFFVLSSCVVIFNYKEVSSKTKMLFYSFQKYGRLLAFGVQPF